MVGVDLDKAAPGGQAIDIVHRADHAAAIEIVDRVERDDGGEAVVRKGQLVGAAEMQATDRLRLAIEQCIFGDIEAECLEARAHPHEILDEEPFGAADIQHAVARLEAELADDVLGNRYPASVIAVSAVAQLARPVEELPAILSSDG